MLLGLAWAPFWLGGNRPFAWGLNGIFFPALVVIYELHLFIQRRSHPIGVTRFAASAALFALALLWIFAQLSPLVPAPLAHPIYGMAADVLDQPILPTISVNRGHTMLALIRLLTAASVFWLTLQLGRNAHRAELLLRAIGVIVACYSAYGLILAAVNSGRIPFFDAGTGEGFVRGTFVNRNSFATYAGLGLIASIAVAFRGFARELAPLDGMRSYRWGAFLETLGRHSWGALIAVLTTLVALLATGSRGGILSTALAVFALFILSWSRRRKGAFEGIEAIAFFTATLIGGFAVFGDVLLGRLAASGLEDVSRLSVYLIALNAILDTPLLGYGYGTFADIFPMYRDLSITRFGVWTKAHDSYIEIFLGLGLFFGAALLLSVGLIVAKCFAGAIKRQRDATPAIAAAAASLLVGVHALVDFSMQMEAVALTFMAILGVGAAQAESSRLLVSD